MDYPVMLYRKSLEDWTIADDEEQVKTLSKEGYQKHADFKGKDTNENDVLDIDEMTKNDIMSNLDDLEVEYNSRDTKDKLAKLLFESISE